MEPVLQRGRLLSMQEGADLIMLQQAVDRQFLGNLLLPHALATVAEQLCMADTSCLLWSLETCKVDYWKHSILLLLLVHYSEAQQDGRLQVNLSCMSRQPNALA